MGDLEIFDVEAAVRHARAIGYRRVVTVGFSMGGAVAVRHAGVLGGVDAVVSVSAPARWYYRGTRPMRQVHWAIERPVGRLAARLGKRTRIMKGVWDPLPLAPYEAAAKISPVPLLVVHGDADRFFPSTTRTRSTRPRTSRRSCGSSPASATRSRRPRRIWSAASGDGPRPGPVPRKLSILLKIDHRAMSM